MALAMAVMWGINRLPTSMLVWGMALALALFVPLGQRSKVSLPWAALVKSLVHKAIAAGFFAGFCNLLLDTPFRSLSFLWLWLVLVAIRELSGQAIQNRRIRLLADQIDGPQLGGELVILGAFGYLGAVFAPDFAPSYTTLFSVLGLWSLLSASRNLWLSKQSTWYASLAFLGQIAVWLLLLEIVAALRDFHLGRVHVAVGGWTCIALTLHHHVTAGRCKSPKESIGCQLRFAVCLTASLWLMRGLATPVLHGANDALWYGTVLADTLKQTRSGVFPLWVGQSPFQFNGAIYPLRIAPAFQYLGALLDLCTLRTLGVFALQNLLLTLTGLAAVASMYRGLSLSQPNHRWIALALSLLFFACPGVLGIVYNNDLYMSWMATPWAVLAVAMTARLFVQPSLRSWLLFGATTGLCWWGHSPIALWVTLLGASMQVARLARPSRLLAEWKMGAGGIIAFALVAAYPIGSVLLFPPEAGVNAAAFQEATAENIVHLLRSVTSQVWLPLSQYGRNLGDFQVGYSLWLLFAFSLFLGWRRSRPGTRIFLLVGIAVTTLLSAFPGVDLFIWNAVPSLVRNITGNWVMNRLYLLLAMVIVWTAAGWLGPWSSQGRWKSITATALLVAACVWSLREADKFVAGSLHNRRPTESATTLLQTENVMLTRFAYLVFPQIPSTFSNAPMDPLMLQELRATDRKTLVTGNQKIALQQGQPVAMVNVTPLASGPTMVFASTTALVLEPGQRYLLDFDFLQPTKNIEGVLQLEGPTFFREYNLPKYGEEHSFGLGGQRSHVMSVWTSSPVPEPVMVRFYPKPDAAIESAALIRISQFRYDPSRLPIKMESWVPYRAWTDMSTPTWLLTPKVFQSHYRAWVNGRPAPIAKSSDGLLMVSLPAGHNKVEIDYSPPVALAALFWLSLMSIISLGAMAAYWGLQRNSDHPNCTAPGI